jgi:GNAT superfamily N-acetyltransferase
MQIDVQRVDYSDIEPLRTGYRQEANCQIIHDSVLRRGMADCWLIRIDGEVAGYGGIWNRYDPGRITEFHTLPEHRGSALPMYRALIEAGGASEADAQTNMPLMLLMLYDTCDDIRAENVLFADAFTSELRNPGGVFRARKPDDAAGPDGEAAWVFECEGEIAACGGFLTHYNPPYGDIFMSVAEKFRRRGIGSYVVQESKRVCREAGYTPAARCNAENAVSRKTLQRAGLLPCGRLLVGKIRRDD